MDFYWHFKESISLNNWLEAEIKCFDKLINHNPLELYMDN